MGGSGGKIPNNTKVFTLYGSLIFGWLCVFLRSFSGYSMITINDFNFKGLRAIIRVDFNVPLNAEQQVTDDTRIRASLPTIRKILADGGSVILMSHLGRPAGKVSEKYSLRHLLPVLGSYLGTNIAFADDCIGVSAQEKAAALQPGEILLLENLRFYPEEEKGNTEFAQKLASLADFYVNDAFGTAHRRHASTAVIADFFAGKRAFGQLMAEEVENLRKVTAQPQHPFVAVIGGAKVSSKINIFMNLVDKVDHFVVGGGMVFTFIKARGGEIGNSLVENDMLDTAREIIRKCEEHGVGLHLPADSVCHTAFEETSTAKVFPSDAIPEGYMGLDIGPLAIADFSEVLENARTVLWNGPVGVFEMEAFKNGTIAVGNSIARATEKGGFSLVGGGDSVAAVNKFGLADQVSYISTGGGAMLEFVEGAVLPGIAAIEGV